MSQKSITHIEGLEKAKHFCAYQERCHKEVEEKLYSWGLTPDEVDHIVILLIQENYLNEERYAQAYVSGKFRIKKWGRKKIIQKLKEKKVSEYCIKKGLEEIDDENYLSVLLEQAQKKYGSLKEKNEFLKKKKTAAYLYSRGFESDLIWTAIEEINSSSN